MSKQKLAWYYDNFLGTPVAEGDVAAADGTRLHWRRFGPETVESAAAVPMFCNNGIGCSTLFWRYVVQHFSNQRSVIVWDYRGHGLSDRPRAGARVGIADHAADGQRVLDAAGVDTAIWMGHSMGSQVILEGYRQSPERFAGLVPVLGAFGKPLDTFLDSDIPARLFPLFYEAGTRVPGPVERVSALLARFRHTRLFAGIMGLVDGRLIPHDDFQAYMDHMATLDTRMFMEMAYELADHDASDVLPDIQVPTLIVAGERDLFTPGWLSMEMQRRIPGAELLMIPAGSHAALVEQPELLHLRLEKFLQDHYN